MINNGIWYNLYKGLLHMLFFHTISTHLTGSMSTTRFASCDSWDLLLVMVTESGSSCIFFFGGGVMGYFVLPTHRGRASGGVGGGVYLCICVCVVGRGEEGTLWGGVGISGCWGELGKVSFGREDVEGRWWYFGELPHGLLDADLELVTPDNSVKCQSWLGSSPCNWRSEMYQSENNYPKQYWNQEGRK